MTSWIHALSHADPVDVGRCLRELLIEEMGSPYDHHCADAIAYWLRANSHELDLEQWDRATEGLLAYCEAADFDGLEEARWLLTPCDQRYQEARDEALADVGEDDFEPLRDEADLGSGDE